MSNESFVTVVVLNWNGKHFLEQNISSVLDQDYRNYQALIVDNNSSDGSKKYIEKLKEEDERVKYLQTGDNLGYAGGNNKGIQWTLKEGKSKYIVILNNDIKAEKNWLENLINGFTSDDIGICASKLLFYYPYFKIKLIPSIDCTINYLSISGLKYYCLEYQKGFSEKGQVVSFPKSLKKGKEYFLAVPYDSKIKNRNLDIRFTKGSMNVCISKKVTCLKESSVMKVDLDGEYVINNAGSTFDKKKMLFIENLIYEFDRPLESKIVDAGCGAAMAIRADLIKKIGMFNEKYWMYFEDSELCYRYGLKGYKTKFIADSIGYHIFWGSSGNEVSKNQLFYGTRNKLWFIRRYFGLATFLYFYSKTMLRVCIWFVKAIYSSKARVSFKNYFLALINSLKSDM